VRGLVDLDTGQLEVLYHPLGQPVPGIVGGVFFQQPAQQIAVLRDRESDCEGELIAEGVHQPARVIALFSPR
jgi:hypothetical protein